MKKLLLLFAALLTLTTANAQQVSEQEALAKAQQFFGKAGQSQVGKGMAPRKAPVLTLANNRDEFYVFNDEANGGYVVISGEERMPDVLAYSYDGLFDANNLPCNMQAWLDGYAEQVNYLREHLEAKAAKRTAPERENVEPLLTCWFGQGTPYNDKCPIVDGQHCVTGCVATAMAQIMHYWQWPKQTTDVIPGYTTSTLKIDMPAQPITTIDWDNILDRYVYNQYNEKQADAISTLMLLCGTSAFMDYTPQGSGASTYDAAQAMYQFFDYDELFDGVSRDYYDSDEWEQMIYEELYNKRPILYSGFSGDSGHAFVLDGYEDGYFHVNWGWGGAYSYVLMTDVGGWNKFQNAIIGIQPASPDNLSRYAVLDNGTITLYYDREKPHRSGTILKKEEWANYKDQITKCVIDPSFANLSIRSLGGFFSGWSQLESIEGIENLNTSKVMDMSSMFQGCSSLTNLDLSSYNTSNVCYMYCMFEGCSGLKKLDLSNFKTDKVINMNWMFGYCSGLTSLDLSCFNTSNVIYMNGLFGDCSNLKSLDLSGFKTDKVTEIRYMFQNCSSLTSLDVSGFKTDKVTNMYRLFYNCYSLTSLDVSGFETGNVTNMSWMFSGCSGLTSLDVSNFKTDQVTNMGWMFGDCKNLMYIIAGEGWNTSNITDGSYMFAGCYELVGGNGTPYDRNHTDYTYAHIDGGKENPGYFTAVGAPLPTARPYAVLNDDNTILTFYYDDQREARNGMKIGSRPWKNNSSTITTVVFDNSMANCTSITSTAYWFNGCENLTTIIGIENLNTDNVTNMVGMFYDCSALTNLDVSGFKTDKVTDMSGMFWNCSNLMSLDVSGFKTDNVTDMYGVFYGCSGLTSLDLSGFKTDNVTDMRYMFAVCPQLSTIYASGKWNMSNVGKSDVMFYCCTNLVGGAGTIYDENHIDGEYARIDEGPNNPGYFTYKVIQYEIKYIVDGREYKTYKLWPGDAITPEPEPVKDTYLFSGWSEIPDVMPARDVIVTGTFERHFDIRHVVKVLNFTMGDYATPDEQALYDMNNDGELNIGDVILIVKNILDYGGNVQFAPNNGISTMTDLAHYTAAQFELKTGNANVKNIRLVENMEQSHQLMYRQTDAETYAIVIFSPSNELLKLDDGHVIVVDIDGSGAETMTINNIMAAKPTGETSSSQRLQVATGIQQTKLSKSPAEVYDMKGQRQNGNRKGIYIINGKKTVVR